MFITTTETIRYAYLIDEHILACNSMLLIGPTGSGKSLICREIIFNFALLVPHQNRQRVLLEQHERKDAQYFIDSKLPQYRRTTRSGWSRTYCRTTGSTT